MDGSHGRLPTKDGILNGVFNVMVFVVCVKVLVKPVSICFLLALFQQDMEENSWSFASQQAGNRVAASETEQAIKMAKRKTRPGNLYSILFAETVYSLWIQRNERVFGGNRKTEDQVLHQIM